MSSSTMMPAGSASLVHTPTRGRAIVLNQGPGRILVCLGTMRPDQMRSGTSEPQSEACQPVSDGSEGAVAG